MTTKEFYKYEDYKLEWKYEDDKVNPALIYLFFLKKKRVQNQKNRKGDVLHRGNIYIKQLIN